MPFPLRTKTAVWIAINLQREWNNKFGKRPRYTQTFETFSPRISVPALVDFNSPWNLPRFRLPGSQFKNSIIFRRIFHKLSQEFSYHKSQSLWSNRQGTLEYLVYIGTLFDPRDWRHSMSLLIWLMVSTKKLIQKRLKAFWQFKQFTWTVIYI